MMERGCSVLLMFGGKLFSSQKYVKIARVEDQINKCSFILAFSARGCSLKWLLTSKNLHSSLFVFLLDSLNAAPRSID
jgi:hypothetical protein